MANICFMQAFLAWTMCLVWIGQTFPQTVQQSIRLLVCFCCAVAFSSLPDIKHLVVHLSYIHRLLIARSTSNSEFFWSLEVEVN